jgi:hypothetical protein
VLTVGLDVVDERIEQVLFLAGHPLGLGREVRGGEGGRLDDFPDALLVNRLDSLFGGVDFVGELLDFGSVEGVLGTLGRAVTFGLQLLDELASVSVETLAQLLELVGLALAVARGL